MTPDDSTSHHLHELLEQARHELRLCKKSLAFKESLLTDLELENAELADAKEKLYRELECLKRQESRRSEFERANDDCVDDGYGHWSHDEDDFPAYPMTEIEKAQQELGRCSTCETHDRESNKLFERIEELQRQLEIAQKVNKALQEDVTQKAAQIADLTESLRQKQAREEQLEADLEFTAAERETALRDLHDSQMTFLSSGRNSVEYSRSSSIGSSLAEELGLDTKEFQQLSPSFVDWDELLAEPEASDFDLRFAERSQENLEDAESWPLDDQEGKVPGEESSQNILPEDGNLPESDTQREPTDLSSRRHQDEWKNIQYSGEFSFGWRSLVCCVPEPGTPVRKETIVGAKARNPRKSFLSFLKRRSGGKR